MTSKNKIGDIREARNVLLSEVKPEHYHHVWSLLYEIDRLKKEVRINRYWRDAYRELYEEEIAND